MRWSIRNALRSSLRPRALAARKSPRQLVAERLDAETREKVMLGQAIRFDQRHVAEAARIVVGDDRTARHGEHDVVVLGVLAVLVGVVAQHLAVGAPRRRYGEPARSCRDAWPAPRRCPAAAPDISRADRRSAPCGPSGARRTGPAAESADPCAFARTRWKRRPRSSGSKPAAAQSRLPAAQAWARCRRQRALAVITQHHAPGSPFSPTDSMPAMAAASSLSELSPETPTAPSSDPSASRISTPPGTGISEPPTACVTAAMK